MSSRKKDFEDRSFDGETAEYDATILGRFRLEREIAILQILRGSDTGMRVPLTKASVTIGRTVDSDLVLHDSKISRVHARIDRVDDTHTWTLTDVDSTNGTFLNNRPVTGTVRLANGDKIFLGHTILKFSLEDEVESQSGETVDRYLFRDDLTGLVVKRRFYNELGVSLQLAVHRSAPLSLLMMDMDGLKGVNDRHGHSTGAFVIQEAGKRIGRICNPIGQACRFGGDEFVAYLKDHDKPAALALATQLCATIRDVPFEKDSLQLSLSISVGVATCPDDGVESDVLSRVADEALYRAKAKGRDVASD